MREAMTEVVAYDVAGLIARMFVVANVLAAAEVCYKHRHCTDTDCLHYW